MKYLIIPFLIAISITAYKPKPAYRIFKGENAKALDFDKMMKGLRDADVVFFGESHNNSIGHWLQLQILKHLAEVTEKKVIIGAEMFEADAQLVLDEYLQGLIKEDHLMKEGKVWKNYKTDYAPIVNYAKSQQISVVATNIPRRYASIVARNGLEALQELDEVAKAYIAPLPIEVDYELSSYMEIADMMGGHAGTEAGSTNMIDAQAVKDATMAWSIAKRFGEGNVFYHLNGSFHTKNHEGIIAFLRQYRPKLRVVSIATVDQENLEELSEENMQMADYIIAIPADMTKTY
jgi:uncharacterized iron-regulated protein